MGEKKNLEQMTADKNSKFFNLCKLNLRHSVHNSSFFNAYNASKYSP